MGRKMKENNKTNKIRHLDLYEKFIDTSWSEFTKPLFQYHNQHLVSSFFFYDKPMEIPTVQ